VRAGLVITLVLAAITASIVSIIDIPVVTGEPINIRGVWRSFHSALKRLLISDIVIRMCEALPDVLIILYVTNVLSIGVAQYSVLVAIQLVTSIVVYFPAAKMADRYGRKPFVVATFICFSIFPLAVVLSHSFDALVVAFVIGGLRELGEPARKAMIVDLADPTRRGRTVGLYYLTRSLSITPASVIGGLLWKISPAIPFFVACAIGLVGTLIFVLTVERRYAS
jgi:MFS family permease